MINTYLQSAAPLFNCTGCQDLSKNVDTSRPDSNFLTSRRNPVKIVIPAVLGRNAHLGRQKLGALFATGIGPSEVGLIGVELLKCIALGGKAHP